MRSLEAAFIWHLGVLLSGSQLSDISLNKFVLVEAGSDTTTTT